MRIDLRVPYAQKDAAKALGARWDAARKIWYVLDPKDLSPLAQWLPTGGAEVGFSAPQDTSVAAPVSAQKNGAAGVKDARAAVFTGPATVAVLCDCAVLPWEPCVHSPAA